MKIEELLRKFVLQVLNEEKDKEDNLLGEPDLSKEDERDEDGEEAHHDEQNVTSNIAGYTLPLGASNSPTTLKQRGDIAGSGFGGAKPAKKKKKKKSQDDQDKDWYK
ncbi:MAG TPA: hypothetical protein EYF95_00075 [Flavobacteriales bacterium]|jgi:hypothetical protein|nr:hypothetical protein [Flavobacteriales bacterium]